MNRLPSAASREGGPRRALHAARETWGVLTTGTDLGNAHFTIAAAKGALQLLRFRCRPPLGHLPHGLHDLFWVVRFLRRTDPTLLNSGARVRSALERLSTDENAVRGEVHPESEAMRASLLG